MTKSLSARHPNLSASTQALTSIDDVYRTSAVSLASSDKHKSVKYAFPV